MVIDLTEDILKLSTVHSDLVHVFTLYKLFFFFLTVSAALAKKPQNVQFASQLL